MKNKFISKVRFLLLVSGMFGLLAGAVLPFTAFADSNVPQISGVVVTQITPYAATITWTTSIIADSNVDYGPTISYGFTAPYTGALSTSHSMALTGLSPVTTYYYQVRSANGFGGAILTGLSFTTASTATLAPIVTLAAATGTTLPISPVAASGTASVGFTAKAGAAAIQSAQLIIDGSNLGSPLQLLNGDGQYTFNWDTTLAGNGCHSVQVSVTDSMGLKGTSASAEYDVTNLNPTNTTPFACPGGSVIVPPPTQPIQPVQPIAPAQAYPPSTVRLVNDNGTFYLLFNGQRQGITDPGILASYGLSLSQAQPATASDLAVAAGSPLSPGDGALVKTASDPTVYLIADRQRHGFVSADVFTTLGYNFANVVIVTQPELDALALGAVVSNPSAAHLSGANISNNGTIYWVNSGSRYAYPSLDVYNSWNIPNSFSTVIPANTADLALPDGGVRTARSVNQ